MKKKFNKIRQGFTLVEMMFSVLIFLFVSGALYGVTLVGQESWQVNKTKTELQQELRKAMGWMIQDLRQAGDSSITDVPADGSNYASITFKTPSGVSSGTLDWDANTTQFILGGTGGSNLLRVKGLVTDVIAISVQTLQFTRSPLSPDILEVVLLARANTPSGVVLQQQINFDIQLRN